MSTFQDALDYSKKNPNSEFANEFRRRLESGQLDNEARQAGINLPKFQPEQTDQQQPSFLRSLVTDPIKTLLVKPADRFAEVVGRTGILGKNIQRGYGAMADEGTTRTYAGIPVEQQKAFGQGGGKQIIGDAAKSASYLYTGGELPGAVAGGLKGQVVSTAAHLAKAGAISGGAYSFGDAIQDAENSPSDIAYKTLFGAGVGGATGLVLGAATPLAVKTVNGVRKFANVEALNSELQKLNNITLKPTPKQAEKWMAQGVDPIKTYTEIFADKVPQVDKNNRFVQQSIEDFVNKVDDVYRPASEGFNTILRNSPEVNSLSSMERKALSDIDRESLTPVQRLQARSKVQAEISALRDEAKQSGKLLGNDNIPVALTDNYKDRFWANTKYFGDESTSVTNASNRALGRAFAKDIEDVTTDVNVKAFNKQLQQYIVLKDFLASKTGALAGDGGKMTRLVSRGVGSVVGSHGGPVGSITGALTGDKLAQMWINPENSPYRWLISRQLQKLPAAERQTLEQQANEIIQRMYEKRVSTLALPAGNPSNIAIPMLGESTMEKPAGKIFNESMNQRSSTMDASTKPTMIEPNAANIEPTNTTKPPKTQGNAGFSKLGTVLGGAGLAAAGIGLDKASKIDYVASDTPNNKVDSKIVPNKSKGYQLPKDELKTKLREEIALRESRGAKNPYTAINNNKNGTTDYGKYQVNEQSLKTYGKMFLGKEVTPKEFLASPDLQEEFFDKAMDYLIKRGAKNISTFLVLWHKGWSDLSTKRVEKLKKDPAVMAYLKKPQ